MTRKLDDFLGRKFVLPTVGPTPENQAAGFVRRGRLGFDQQLRRFEIGKTRPVRIFTQNLEQARMHSFRFARLQKLDENRVDQIFTKSQMF